MVHRKLTFAAACVLAIAVVAFPRPAAHAADIPDETAASPVRPDVIWVPTPEHVVAAMLTLARLKPGDVMYDLGCGDGRIAIAAAKRGAGKAVCVDIDPARIQEARDNARSQGVLDKVTFIQGDLFELDFSDADVVTLYLLPELNLRLRPKILALRPGTRIVSHAFDMGDWKPDATQTVEGKKIFFWTVPNPAPRVQARTPPSR